MLAELDGRLIHLNKITSYLSFVYACTHGKHPTSQLN